MEFKNKPKVIKRISKSRKVVAKPSEPPEKNRLVRSMHPDDLIRNIEVAEKVVVGHAKEFILKKFPNLRNVRNLVFVWLFLMGSLLLSVALFNLASEKTFKTDKFIKGGIFSEGILGEVKNLNPLFASSDAEKAFSKLAFVRLYDIDIAGKLNSELAEKVETNNEYKNFGLKIREDAFWSDNHKITANDVIFTINLMKDRLVNQSSYESWRNVKASKIDDYRVSFEMPRASKLTLYTLDFPILPEHKLKDVAPEKMRESDFSKNPITSGEFIFKDAKYSNEKTTLTLERNDKYFAGVSKLSRFEIVAFANKEKIKQSLLRGEISASSDLSLMDFSNSEKSNLREKESDINRGIYAFLNHSSEIFKDKSVRQAVRNAIDVSKLRAKIPHSSRLDFPTLNREIAGDPKKINQDIAAAENILENSGWKKNNDSRVKNGQKLKTSLAAINEGYFADIAKELKSQLEKIGFEVDLILAEKNDKSGNFVRSILTPRNYDILIYEIDFGADLDIYPFWHSSQSGEKGLNFANYSDAVADDILLNIRNSQNDNEKRSLVSKFANRWESQVASIPIAQKKSVFVYRKSVYAYSSENILTKSLDKYADVKYWQVEKAKLYKTP